MNVWETTQGDTLFRLPFQFTQDGEPLNTSTYTVKVKVTDNNKNIIIDKTSTGVTPIDATVGKYVYDFSTVAVANYGTFWFWAILYSGTEKATAPQGRQMKIIIYPDEGE